MNPALEAVREAVRQRLVADGSHDGHCHAVLLARLSDGELELLAEMEAARPQPSPWVVFERLRRPQVVHRKSPCRGPSDPQSKRQKISA